MKKFSSRRRFLADSEACSASDGCQSSSPWLASLPPSLLLLSPSPLSSLLLLPPSLLFASLSSLQRSVMTGARDLLRVLLPPGASGTTEGLLLPPFRPLTSSSSSEEKISITLPLAALTAAPLTAASNSTSLLLPPPPPPPLLLLPPPLRSLAPVLAEVAGCSAAWRLLPPPLPPQR